MIAAFLITAGAVIGVFVGFCVCYASTVLTVFVIDRLDHMLGSL